MFFSFISMIQTVNCIRTNEMLSLNEMDTKSSSKFFSTILSAKIGLIVKLAKWNALKNSKTGVGSFPVMHRTQILKSTRTAFCFSFVRWLGTADKWLCFNKTALMIGLNWVAWLDVTKRNKNFIMRRDSSFCFRCIRKLMERVSQISLAVIQLCSFLWANSPF